MIQTDMLYQPSLGYIKKERFTGSCQGMRYLLEKAEVVVGEQEEKDAETGETVTKQIKEPRILAAVWPEPFCYEKTPEEQKTSEYFDLSEDGLKAAWNWISERQDEYAN